MQSSNKFLACCKRTSFSPTFTAAFLELNGKWEANTQYMIEELNEHTIIKDRRKLASPVENSQKNGEENKQREALQPLFLNKYSGGGSSTSESIL